MHSLCVWLSRLSSVHLFDPHTCIAIFPRRDSKQCYAQLFGSSLRAADATRTAGWRGRAPSKRGVEGKERRGERLARLRARDGLRARELGERARAGPLRGIRTREIQRGSEAVKIEGEKFARLHRAPLLHPVRRECGSSIRIELRSPVRPCRSRWWLVAGARVRRLRSRVSRVRPGTTAGWGPAHSSTVGDQERLRTDAPSGRVPAAPGVRHIRVAVHPRGRRSRAWNSTTRKQIK